MRYYVQLVDLTAIEADSDRAALEVAASKIAERLQMGQARIAIVDQETPFAEAQTMCD